MAAQPPETPKPEETQEIPLIFGSYTPYYAHLPQMPIDTLIADMNEAIKEK